MVADSFIGNGKYDCSSINQTAHMAMRLPMVLVSTIRHIANSEYLHLCLQHKILNKYGSKSDEERAMLGETAQVNTIY